MIKLKTIFNRIKLYLKVFKQIDEIKNSYSLNSLLLITDGRYKPANIDGFTILVLDNRDVTNVDETLLDIMGQSSYHYILVYSDIVIYNNTKVHNWLTFKDKVKLYINIRKRIWSETL